MGNVLRNYVRVVVCLIMVGFLTAGISFAHYSEGFYIDGVDGFEDNILEPFEDISVFPYDIAVVTSYTGPGCNTIYPHSGQYFARTGYAYNTNSAAWEFDATKEGVVTGWLCLAGPNYSYPAAISIWDGNGNNAWIIPNFNGTGNVWWMTNSWENSDETAIAATLDTWHKVKFVVDGNGCDAYWGDTLLFSDWGGITDVKKICIGGAWNCQPTGYDDITFESKETTYSDGFEDGNVNDWSNTSDVASDMSVVETLGDLSPKEGDYFVGTISTTRTTWLTKTLTQASPGVLKLWVSMDEITRVAMVRVEGEEGGCAFIALNLGSNGHFSYRLGDQSGVDTGLAISADTWYELKFEADETGLDGYLNGDLIFKNFAGIRDIKKITLGSAWGTAPAGYDDITFNGGNVFRVGSEDFTDDFESGDKSNWVDTSDDPCDVWVVQSAGDLSPHTGDYFCRTSSTYDVTWMTKELSVEQPGVLKAWVAVDEIDGSKGAAIRVEAADGNSAMIWFNLKGNGVIGYRQNSTDINSPYSFDPNTWYEVKLEADEGGLDGWWNGHLLFKNYSVVKKIKRIMFGSRWSTAHAGYDDITFNGGNVFRVGSEDFTDDFESGDKSNWVDTSDDPCDVWVVQSAGDLSPHTGDYFCRTSSTYDVTWMTKELSVEQPGVLKAWVAVDEIDGSKGAAIRVEAADGNSAMIWFNLKGNGVIGYRLGAIDINSPYSFDPNTWYEVKLEADEGGLDGWWNGHLLFNNYSDIKKIKKIIFGSAWGTAPAGYDDITFERQFFPLGWYEDRMFTETAAFHEAFEAGAEQGMNALNLCYTNWSSSTTYQNYALDAAAQLGLKAMVQVHHNAMCGTVAESEIINQVNALKNNSSLWAWYLMDEPYYSDVNALDLQEKYNLISCIDSKHHSMAVVYSPDPADDYLAKDSSAPNDIQSNIIACDVYPCIVGSDEFEVDLWESAVWTNRYKDYLTTYYGKSANWNVVQACEFEDGIPSHALRFPTYDEQRYLIYAPITVGADGLFFWKHESSDEQHRVKVIGSIVPEIRLLIEAIVSNSNAVTVASNRDYDTNSHGINDVTYLFGKEQDNDMYLIAVNNTDTNNSVTFTLTGSILAETFGWYDMSIPVLWEERSVLLNADQNNNKWTITDVFAPYDVHVYKIGILSYCGQALTSIPANGKINASVIPILSWTAGDGATSHNVYFGTDSTPDETEYKGNQAGTTYDLGTLTTSTTYYWRIDEVGNGGITTGTVWSFTTATAPGQATTPSPANSATGVSITADLSWSAGSGTNSHNVYFGTDSTPDETEYKGNQAGTTYDLGTLTASTTYYWRIDEVGNGGTTTGIVWSFTTETPPTFVSAGSITSGTGTITPSLPGSITTGDILLLFIENSNQAVSISNQNGGTWTQVTNSPQYTGTAAGTTGVRLAAYWSRYNGTQGNPTVSDSGNHQMGRIVAIRGAVSSGNPWDITAGGVEAASDTSGSIPGATTTVGNTLVVTAIASALPDATGTTNFSSWTNANMESLTERIDNTVTAGNGGGIGVATGIKATAGAYGNTTVTLGSSAYKAMMSIVIKP